MNTWEGLIRLCTPELSRRPIGSAPFFACTRALPELAGGSAPHSSLRERGWKAHSALLPLDCRRAKLGPRSVLEEGHGYTVRRMAGDELTTEEFGRWWRETGAYELQQLLLWRWDPIGVADDFPYTADEYDDYAPQVVQLLRRGGEGKALVDHLRTVEREAMDGPLTSRKRLGYLASFLSQWYQNSQASWREFGPVRR